LQLQFTRRVQRQEVPDIDRPKVVGPEAQTEDGTGQILQPDGSSDTERPAVARKGHIVEHQRIALEGCSTPNLPEPNSKTRNSHGTIADLYGAAKQRCLPGTTDVHVTREYATYPL
jgi:hypothetical protein